MAKLNKTLSVSAKVSDRGYYRIIDEGTCIWVRDGYVPSRLGIGGGDYIEFDVDLETGQILNWEPPKESDINDLINEDY